MDHLVRQNVIGDLTDTGRSANHPSRSHVNHHRRLGGTVAVRHDHIEQRIESALRRAPVILRCGRLHRRFDLVEELPTHLARHPP